MKKIFILTGEPSGDKLASTVISKLQQKNSNIDYLSVGGTHLDKLGIIDLRIIEEWKQGLYSNKRDTSWQLWTLVAYKQWMESRGKL